MNEKEQSKSAKAFAEFWKNKGYEKGQSQTFWLQLLSQVYGIENPETYIEFEDQVHIDKSTGFIDGYIPKTKVLIEQKSIDKDLRKGIRQSDGSMLNPFQQAKKYIAELPVSKHPKYVITCNFKSFLVYNMENPNGEPEEILLENLEKEYYRLQFLVESGNEHLKKEMEISMEAGRLVGKLYDEILKLYIDPESEETLKSLNALCVRLVFCLYAEDSGIFGKRLMFHDYLERFEARDLRMALINLFKVLDTKVENRDKYMDAELASFPYVNGGLFADENIEIPNLTDNVKELLLSKASEDFDWSDISPTIFGAVFESTLNPETRRSGGMHYTSIENIHKVIDPLFLNDLKQELEEIEAIPVLKIRKQKLEEFQNKLASLKFLDPACGSGNFLTETYLSLRKLENEVMFNLTGGQIQLGDENNNPIKVSIGQFYGIEINDFAVTVAKTALWIAESQMMKETENILHIDLDFLPLKSYTNIVEANALRIDWNDVVPKEEINYIMGNPPFVGMKEQKSEQKEDMKLVIPLKLFKQLDYVACWYFKASEYIENTRIEVAFVSSNSITQGEQALTMWQPLFNNYNLKINFAYRTFKWDSEATLQAHVHCVIIGFAKFNRNEKIIYEDTKIIKCDNINQYLTNGKNIFITKVGIPLCDVEEMTKGAQLIDGGNFMIGEQKEYEEIIAKEPNIKQYIRKYYNARDLLNGANTKYVLYLEECPPDEINKSKVLKERVQAVYKYRAENESPSTNVLKDSPQNYFQPQVPKGKSIVIPVVSSENRKYIPICFMPEGMVYTNALFFVDNASIYTFGILTSNVHMAWTKTVCGRMKSDFRYSNTMVYNTFPFPNPTENQKKKIEKTAQAILDARSLYPNSSLADLYDELTMPKELRTAHQNNDKAVMEAYGFPVKSSFTESDCVAELMKMYEELTKS